MFNRKKKIDRLEQELSNIAKQSNISGKNIELIANSLTRIADTLQKIQELNRNKKCGNVVELKAETSRSLNACDSYHQPEESLCAVSVASNVLPSETY